MRIERGMRIFVDKEMYLRQPNIFDRYAILQKKMLLPVPFEVTWQQLLPTPEVRNFQFDEI